MACSRVVLGGAITFIALIAVACGGDDDDDSGDSGSTGSGSEGSGAWTGEYETGTEVSVDLFVDSSDATVAAFEAFREAAEAPAAVYGRVTATNNGSAADNGRFVTLTDGDGDPLAEDAVILGFACAEAGRWVQADGVSQDAIGLYQELFTGECGGLAGGPSIPPGETVTYLVLVESESEPAYERVFTGSGRELSR